MKARPVKLQQGGYVECARHLATHVMVNIPGPVGLLTLPVILSGTRDGTNAWTWNGSTGKPTLRPSVRTTKPHEGLVCHSWVNDGNAQFLEDTTHDLRGQAVPLLDVPALPPSRACASCGVTATGDDEIAARFYVRRRKSGHTSYRRFCKECNSAAAIKWRNDNPQAWAEIQARHRAKQGV